MAKKVRSARGVEVDFDLLKVKQQIAESPAIDVSARENFVEKRLRRRTKRSPTPVKPLVIEPAAELLDAEQFEPEVEEQLVESVEPEQAPTKRGAKPIRKAQD